MTVLRELQNWIATKRPDLRRRKETIESQQSEWATTPSPGAPVLAAFDENLYEKAKHDPDVYAAIVNLTKATESGEVDPKTLTQLEKHADDSPFALALLTTLGATAYRKTLGETVSNKQLKKLGTPLGKLLSTASPNLPPTWHNALTADIWANRNEVRGLTQALRNGTFPHAFVMSAVKNLDMWARNRSTPDHEIVDDILTIIAKNPTRAQDYFINDPTALKYWVTTDHAEETQAQFAKILELATTTFRDQSGTPQNPSRGYWSAKFTSEFIHLEGQRIEKERFPVVPPATTALILANYISDVDRTATGRRSLESVGVYGKNDSGIPGHDNWGAYFDRRDLMSVMREAFKNDKSFTTVIAAQTAFSDLLLDHGAKKLKETGKNDFLQANGNTIGASFGMIASAAGLTKIEQGKELDESQKRKVKLVSALVNSCLAIPQTAAWPVGAGIVAAWTGIVEDALEGDFETKARKDANTTADQIWVLTQDLTAKSMLKHGLFKGSEHPWASLQDMKKSDDPRLSPYNFLHRDGKTLMNMDEMVDKNAGNFTDMYRRLDAFDRWLNDGSAGGDWIDVRTLLRQGFSDSFDRFD
ncbi:hypothetical protein DP939_37210 [Spongiactinospora rosea]|uniref:DUF6571 domain-containing protein n=1 Tax=Spongiactinospora rosea TaxID=2248750 RepID=A0A366LM94_9ACTN|nr:hypothetical protein DP939_37210 [Spongiactinospora rosea]